MEKWLQKKVAGLLKERNLTVIEASKSMGLERAIYYRRLAKNSPDADFIQSFKEKTGINITDVISEHNQKPVENKETDMHTREEYELLKKFIRYQEMEIEILKSELAKHDVKPKSSAS